MGGKSISGLGKETKRIPRRCPKKRSAAAPCNTFDPSRVQPLGFRIQIQIQTPLSHVSFTQGKVSVLGYEVVRTTTTP